MVFNYILNKYASRIVNGEILENNEFYQKINKQGMKLCENYELDYDAKENPFLR